MQCRANYVMLRPRTLGARDLGNQIVDALELGKSTKAKLNVEKRENVSKCKNPHISRSKEQ